jgi:hypothetical protein
VLWLRPIRMDVLVIDGSSSEATEITNQSAEQNQKAVVCRHRVSQSESNNRQIILLQYVRTRVLSDLMSRMNHQNPITSASIVCWTDVARFRFQSVSRRR